VLTINVSLEQKRFEELEKQVEELRNVFDNKAPPKNTINKTLVRELMEEPPKFPRIDEYVRQIVLSFENNSLAISSVVLNFFLQIGT
jgi:hypothetical protein